MSLAHRLLWNLQTTSNDSQCRTPNMDVACNRFIKFDAFREYALGKLAADLVATGEKHKHQQKFGAHILTMLQFLLQKNPSCPRVP